MDGAEGFTTAVGVEVVAELLVIATAVALVTRRIRIPYTVALVLVGLGVGFSHLLHPIGLSTDVILLVFLPPLLFEGTAAMDLATLRAKWLEVLVLALPVTLLCAGAVAATLHWGFGYPWLVALLVGAILSPTDPVSVLAILRETGVSKRLAHVVDGESCFNDGVGVVLFLILTRALGGDEVTAGGAVKLFTVEVAGGLAVGVVLGLGASLLLKQLDDHLLEVMISVALAYGTYVLAERLHVSGVIAVVAAGLIVGSWGREVAMSPTTRLALSHFWEVAAFIANSLLFLLVGIAVESARLGEFALTIAAVFVALTGARFVLVHLVGLVLARTGRELPPAWRHVIAWAGLRGSIPIALALGVVLPAGGGGPTQAELLTVVFGVVLVSLLAQGLTVKPLIVRLGLAAHDPRERELERLAGERLALVAAGERLDELSRTGQLPPALERELRTEIDARAGELQAAIEAYLQAHPELSRSRRDDAVRALLLAERAALETAYGRGLLSQETLEALHAQVDVALERADAVAFSRPAPAPDAGGLTSPPG
ncbi:MAG: Na+/H+ antiporter [Planctomycetes bacterium]|nr:Na+/H+ antiporter [Planctomycetota bacterium]